MKEISAGGIILNDGKVAIVSQREISFSFPKGHMRKSETTKEAAYREILEETGLKKADLKYIKELGIIKRPITRSGNQKDIHIFLFTTDKKELKSKDKNNPAAFWVRVQDVSKMVSNKHDKAFFEEHKEGILAYSE